jgi:hypothetical protein
MTIEISVPKLKKEVFPLSVVVPFSASPPPPTQDNDSSTLDSLLLECIDEVLTDILSTRSRDAVYSNLERTRFLARNEVPKHLDVFFQLLEEILGKGSKIIGKAIARKLCSRLGLQFEETPRLEFADLLTTVRMRLGESERTDPILEINQ